MPKPLSRSQKQADELRRYALTLPETRADHPWGELVVKVGKKVFVFMGTGGGKDGVRLGVKLKDSHAAALELPVCEAMGYGLGKHGWVTVQFAPGAAVPLGLLKEWIDESYRSVAPKKLVGARSGETETAVGAKRRPPASRKPVAKARSKRAKG